MFSAFAFYLFAAILSLSALMVISARNPVHSVLFLILAFFNASGLFVLLGAEFVAFILAIVYVGAVAVLFLFVVMMLDVDFSALRQGLKRHAIAGFTIGALILAELCIMFKSWGGSPLAAVANPSVLAEGDKTTNTEMIGRILYTDYVMAFQVAGLVLLVAMIGAIVLTFRRRPDTRRQKIAEQNSRCASDAIEVQKVTSGQGV